LKSGESGCGSGFQRCFCVSNVVSILFDDFEHVVLLLRLIHKLHLDRRCYGDTLMLIDALYSGEEVPKGLLVLDIRKTDFLRRSIGRFPLH
jgi:hypothetical protein